ncbi:MAG: GNAT family N-acetyltransferase [Mesorhizobium sp.]|nr:MAG: GNAT family N-acetyltransferase [Mesorhizobium sp.]
MWNEVVDEKHAKQIAELLNKQNKLVVHYDAQKVLQSAENYLYELAESGDVAACLELKRVQWYQFEVDHLTVHSDFLRRGYGQMLLDQAEQKAMAENGRLLQCTIRHDNAASEGLFTKCAFNRVAQFYYPLSGNNVGVWQKVISPAR